MILNEQGSPEIEYPCRWKYKIICSDVSKVVEAVEKIVSQFEYDLTPSNISLKGKYASLNLSVLVNSDSERLSIYNLLAGQPEIIYVL